MLTSRSTTLRCTTLGPANSAGRLAQRYIFKKISMGRKKTFLERYKKLSLWNRIGLFGSLASIIAGIAFLFPSEKQTISLDKNQVSEVYQAGRDITVNKYKLSIESSNTKPKGDKSVEVIKYKIIDVNKGFMHIKVAKEFLNTKFKIPITLKYKSGRYEPVTLTFTNDPEKGAGIVVTSPERQKTTKVFLNECIRFSGFGPQTYTEDLIFRLYYNKNCVFFVTESGEIQFLDIPPGVSYKPPPIRYGDGFTCVAYFDNENKEDNSKCSTELEELKQYFETYMP